jgi:2-acylglycerol O-acyltransferase 2
MKEGSDFGSNRTLSASSLKGRLSKLSVTPLRPVAALQARVECVNSIPVKPFMSFLDR